MNKNILENLPLKGIKVIDAASFIAAPLVSALMSDYGAEVIKIEALINSSFVLRHMGSCYSIWVSFIVGS